MNGLKEFVKRVLQGPANMLVGSSTTLPWKVTNCVEKSLGSLALEEPTIAAKFLPYEGGRIGYVIDAVTRETGSHESGLAVPPQALWQEYGKTVQQFLDGGKKDVRKMRELVAESNFQLEAGHRILDVGCGAARMMRHFGDIAENSEIWGVDIVAEYIIWCQQHLSPPFRFATTTTFPHLPFEDRYFDLIYCGSLFTHIADLADSWLLELRRITRPNGRIYITIQDKHFEDHLRANYPEHAHLGMLDEFNKTWDTTNRKYSMFVMSRGPRTAQVHYDHDYIRRHWGRLFGVLSITPNAYFCQSAVLLER